MPGAVWAIMIGRSVAVSRRCTTSMYPKDGEVDMSTIPNTQITCILQKKISVSRLFYRKKSVFLNSLFTIHVHVVYLRFVAEKTFVNVHYHTWTS